MRCWAEAQFQVVEACGRGILDRFPGNATRRIDRTEERIRRRDLREVHREVGGTIQPDGTLPAAHGLRDATERGKLGRCRRSHPALQVAMQVEEHSYSSSRTATSSAASMLRIQPSLSACSVPE